MKNISIATILLSCLVVKVVELCAAEVPREFQTGMTWGFAAPPGFFATAEARKNVDDMCALGVRWIVLTPNVWQEQYCSTRQFADFEKSIPDFELMDIIDYIHMKGMRVQLRPMLECHDGTGRHGVIVGDDWERVAGKPRGYCSKWFAAMRARSVWYARLAERTKCEMYCLDSEFDRFIWKSEEWKSVIAAVRKVYSGPVTSSHTIHCGDFDWEKVVADRNHWFYDLDILSVSDYTAARATGDERELSVAGMMRSLEAHRDLLRRVAKAYGKPMMFGECGCGPRRFQAANPSGCDVRQPEDAHEQAVYYEAFIRTFKDEPWCHGFYWWRWNNHSLADPSTAKDPDALSAPSVSFVPCAETQEVLRRLYAELNARAHGADHVFAGRWITDAEMAAQQPRPVAARQLERHLLPPVNTNLFNRHILFRKAFDLGPVREARVYISADDFYKLYVNGTFVGQGPAAGTVTHTPYDAVDVTAWLKPGRNVIAVHTYYQGLVNRVWVSGDNRHGMILDLVADGRTVVSSDPSFLTARHRAYSVASGVSPGWPGAVPGTAGYDTQFMERYDAGAPEVGFERPGFDDTGWSAAVVHPRGGDYRLVPQTVPSVVTEDIRPVSCVKASDGTWRVDFGAVYVGSLTFAAKGPRGAEVRILCGQELGKDGSVRHRMRCNCDYVEQMVLSGGPRDVLEQFDYKSFRHAELQVPAGVEIDRDSIRLRARHRPFALKAKPNFGDDPELAKIWKLCVDSFRWGVQEQIMDCMDREKGYYLGDGIYTMYSYCLLTGDWQPARNFIDDFLRTKEIDRGLMTCANCSFMQEIAEYSLMLVHFAKMYLEATGDVAFVRSRYAALADVVDSYRERYARADGLLANLDKWCVVEWPANYRDGYDADIAEGKVCTDVHNAINAWYVGAVQELNDLAAATGCRPYGDAAKLKAAFVAAFWDAERKLFVDRVGSRHVSMPGNTYAAYFDLMPAAERAAFKANFVRMAEAKFPGGVSFFQFQPLFSYLKREGESALVRAFLRHPGAWLRSIREGATRSIEGWGYDTKWNTSLFHLTMASVVMFLADAQSGEPARQGNRPYEMVRAGRTADEFPPVARMESADGWRVSGERVAATIATDDAKPLFGPASIRLDYRGEGTNAVVRLTPPEPIAVPEDSDTATLWVYGNNIFGNSDYDPPVTKIPLTEIVACYANAAGVTFRKTLGFVYHRDWHLLVGVAKVPRGMKFTGFELKGTFDAETRTLWLTSLCVFRDPQRPIRPKPRAKRAVQVFAGAPQGVNVGADTLPFPTRRETVIPPAVELPRKLEFRFPEAPSDWNGLKFRYGGSDWIDLAVGGGVFPRQLPEGAKVTFRQVGNSLVCDVTSPKPGIERIRFGAAKLPAGSELVTWPFYTYGYYNSYWEPTIPENYSRYTRPKIARTEVGGRTLFIGATFDWTQSNASGPIFDKEPPPDFTLSTGVEYGLKTDGTRNGCFERFVWTFSEDVTDVLPVVPNPVSPYRKETGSSSWASYESTADRAKDIAYLRKIKAAGIAHVTLVDHERMWRDGNESFTFRTETAPGKGGDAAHAAYTRQVIDELGFRYGPYNNYTDYAPINAHWTLDGVGRFASGQLQPGWNRCYAPKPTFAVEMNEVIPPVVQRKFGFNTAYCDVHTATTPWTHTDFDARVPGAGTFAQAFYCYGEIMLLQKRAWGGPVYSEGGCHWLYCGLVDGNYGQDSRYDFWENPWLVDFDLRRLHPLCNNFGMGNIGMFYGARGNKLRQEDRQTWIDRFTAATLAFGHPGFLILNRKKPENLDIVKESYFPVQAIAARYCVANAKEILYAAADGTLHPVSAALANGAARRSQLKVTYDDGTVVAVNGNLTESFTVEVGGVSYVLPPNGWRAETADKSVVSFNGLEDGRRVKYAKSPEYDWKK